MIRVKLVVLGHYEDINSGFRSSVEHWEPGLSKILIRDGTKIPEKIEGWTVIDGPLPFNYARNCNVGFTVTGNADVILCGDDIRFDSPFVQALQETAYEKENCGVATVQLHGQSPFVCGYFKRALLDRVGRMDEQFTGYGYDDSDFCKRMELIGYQTYCTDKVLARHGGGQTFFRRQAEGGPNVQATCDANRARFNAKWNTDLK